MCSSRAHARKGGCLPILLKKFGKMSRLITRALTSSKLCRAGFASHSLTANPTEGPFNFVDGQRVSPVDSLGEMTVVDPSTYEPLCRVEVSGKDEVDRAVLSADSAFHIWSQWSSVDRGRTLISAGRKIRKHLEEIARLEVRNNGKPIWEARVDIASCADSLEYFGGVVPSFSGGHLPLGNGSFAMVTREPLGVIGGIGAWNFPMQTCTWKVAPALACGNTMVYKPSQLTPLTALTLAEILSACGVPDGVLNIVQGEGETGTLLCKHPKVAKISFTGSVPTGVAVASIAALQMKKVTLELGGKSPLIIFDDCDMKNAVKAALIANFLSQGEVCSNGTRVFVHEKISAEFSERLVAATRKLKVGNPHDEDTTVGATISREHADKVLNYISGAVGEGAQMLCGGERVRMPGPLSAGNFLAPCVLGACHDDMRVVQDEVFGAVLALLTFRDDDEVLSRANQSQFGLAGGVFTRDLNRAMRMTQRLQCGTAWVNTYNMYPPQLPFGGYKMSGTGRENGSAALEQFTQIKTVYVEAGDVDCGPLSSG